MMDAPPGGAAHRFDRDASRLNAVEWGAGEPSILCIHGLGGDHRFFGPQIEHFAPRHRVVAVDLRGHGDSEGPPPRDAIRAFAADVAWQCQQLDLGTPIVVGHSRGGHVAAQLAADFPGAVSGLVFLDSSLIFPEDRLDSLEDLAESFRGPQFRTAFRSFAESYFVHSDDAALRDDVVDVMTSLDQPFLLAFGAALGAWRAHQVLPRCGVPSLYIGAREHPEFRRLHELAPSLRYAQTVGAGHFLQLEVPAQVNAMIERFMTVSALT